MALWRQEDGASVTDRLAPRAGSSPVPLAPLPAKQDATQGQKHTCVRGGKEGRAAPP